MDCEYCEFVVPAGDEVGRGSGGGGRLLLVAARNPDVRDTDEDAAEVTEEDRNDREGGRSGTDPSLRDLG
jgi:hypothetical protein